MLDLDLKDKEIIYQLDLNARQTNSQIAKKLKISREVVTYRIKRLIEKEYIKNFTTVLNHHALDLLSYRVFIKFKNMSTKLEEEFVEFVKDKVPWVVKVRGNWSFNTMIFTDNMFKLEEFILEMKDKFCENLVTLHFSQITRIYHYRRAYFKGIQGDSTDYDLMGEVVDKVKLSDDDINILDCIKDNARLSSIEIALKIGISERVVRYKLNNLIKNKVILNFRTVFNLAKFELSYFKIHFKLNAFDKETNKKIEDYLHNHPDVVYKTETIGGWDLEMEIQVKTNKELYRFIDEFSNEFSGLVEDYETMEFEKEYNLSYFNKI